MKNSLPLLLFAGLVLVIGPCMASDRCFSDMVQGWVVKTTENRLDNFKEYIRDNWENIAKAAFQKCFWLTIGGAHIKQNITAKWVDPDYPSIVVTGKRQLCFNIPNSGIYSILWDEDDKFAMRIRLEDVNEDENADPDLKITEIGIVGGTTRVRVDKDKALIVEGFVMDPVAKQLVNAAGNQALWSDVETSQLTQDLTIFMHKTVLMVRHSTNMFVGIALDPDGFLNLFEFDKNGDLSQFAKGFAGKLAGSVDLDFTHPKPLEWAENRGQTYSTWDVVYHENLACFMPVQSSSPGQDFAHRFSMKNKRGEEDEADEIVPDLFPHQDT